MTILARYWGLRHKCKFRWLVDSRIAINRVHLVTRKDYRPTTQPDNIDILSIIQDLHKELRRPLKAQWIKSHQDATKTCDTLSKDAKLNVDADELATKAHSRPRSQPIRSTAHIPATQVSISINKVRYYGNLDANLRFYINGGYMRNYLQAKHAWSNEAWDKLNLPAFGQHIQKISSKHKAAHLKLVHDLLPLGMQKHRCSAVADPTLKLCPSDEDKHHLLRCTANPIREAALFQLVKNLIGSDSHPDDPFGLTLAIMHRLSPERSRFTSNISARQAATPLPTSNPPCTHRSRAHRLETHDKRIPGNLLANTGLYSSH